MQKSVNVSSSVHFQFLVIKSLGRDQDSKKPEYGYVEGSLLYVYCKNSKVFQSMIFRVSYRLA
jgi:hypothetical protein